VLACTNLLSSSLCRVLNCSLGLLRSSWIQIFSYNLCSRFKVDEVSHPYKRFDFLFVLDRYIRKRWFYLNRILYLLLQNVY
jgi:hypothetical protein